ncbi:hypothetical protein BU14_0332s0030 [Porphyra umbilicalis]|uniref:Nudix hydrolase domain-containing protein n=1 Tax=Porphyra umbilicalis TaxID=2786 RepID=A0A1X6NYK3_PORUM|nr:hypothetical protein BU14_0332s0030 [Porphyra umbilicalis]|eukprot:OSX73678.1 hypothetical protein BU14_0332s0030 [Porphyra umbilicalis]
MVCGRRLPRARVGTPNTPRRAWVPPPPPPPPSGTPPPPPLRIVPITAVPAAAAFCPHAAAAPPPLLVANAPYSVVHHLAVLAGDGTPLYDVPGIAEPRGAVGLPVAADGRVALLRTYRPVPAAAAAAFVFPTPTPGGHGFVSVEAPRGFPAGGESAAAAAMREVAEEVGLPPSAVGGVRPLGWVNVNTSVYLSDIPVFAVRVAAAGEGAAGGGGGAVGGGPSRPPTPTRPLWASTGGRVVGARRGGGEGEAPDAAAAAAAAAAADAVAAAAAAALSPLADATADGGWVLRTPLRYDVLAVGTVRVARGRAPAAADGAPPPPPPPPPAACVPELLCAAPAAAADALFASAAPRWVSLPAGGGLPHRAALRLPAGVLSVRRG